MSEDAEHHFPAQSTSGCPTCQWEVLHSANSLPLPVHGHFLFVAVFSMVIWKKQVSFHPARYWHWMKVKNCPVISNSWCCQPHGFYSTCSLVAIMFLRQTTSLSLFLYSDTEKAFKASLIPEFSYLHWADVIADFTTCLCLVVSVKASALFLE